MQSTLVFNLEKSAFYANRTLPILVIFFFCLGHFYSFYWHFLTVGFLMLATLNFYYLYIQKDHALLSNFGFIAQARYLAESIGPELRQYLFSSDTEEKPFTRVERAEVYRKSKDMDASSAFGSQLLFDGSEYKLLHSMYPVRRKETEKFSLCLGEERSIKKQFTLSKPIVISAMSFGSLGSHAVRAMARGAFKSAIPMNTGEGGFPKYHLMEGCDLIFQMGTAKFGCRNSDASLNEQDFEKIAQLKQVKMIEIKLSQGAKPGKGGVLPKEKITEEIAELRGISRDKDVISPPFHIECQDAESTLNFVKKVQEISQLPVGFKFCLGRPEQFLELVKLMKKQKAFPDYIALDGAEGGTGAAPRAFMDDVGYPLMKSLPLVQKILIEEGVRDKFKLFCAGKLINPSKQFMALSLGADACYTARGFMLAVGCIQAMQCNTNNCPVGVTSHKSNFQHGLDIEEKSDRVKNYVNNMDRDYYSLLAAMGKTSFSELSTENIAYPNASW